MEFSDDEEEKRSKAKQRNKNKESNDGDQIPGAKNIRRKKQKQYVVHEIQCIYTSLYSLCILTITI